jgi:hypothetical protein
MIGQHDAGRGVANILEQDHLDRRPRAVFIAKSLYGRSDAEALASVAGASALGHGRRLVCFNSNVFYPNARRNWQ